MCVRVMTASCLTTSLCRCSVFWDLYCAAPDRRETCEHSSEAKAFHDYVSTVPLILLQGTELNPRVSRPPLWRCVTWIMGVHEGRLLGPDGLVRAELTSRLLRHSGTPRRAIATSWAGMLLALFSVVDSHRIL